MTNFECCPKCASKSKVQSKIDGIQHRKCLGCGHNFRTRIVSADKASSVEELLADYGMSVSAKILTRLTTESNVEEIRHYLDNQARMISHYEMENQPVKNHQARMISHYEMENQPVKNPTGFMMNAILTHYPMPPNWYDGQAVSVSASQLNGHSASQLNGHEIPKNEAADTWAGILERLEQVMTRATFDNCLRNSKGVYQSESMLVVQVVRRSALEWIEERLIESIQRESELEIRFIV